MKLTILQRIQLAPLVPQKGSFEDLIIAEDLMKKLHITQSELEENEIKTIDQGNDRSSITMKTNPEKEIEFTELESNLIKRSLEKMQQDKTLEPPFVPLYRLFVLGDKLLPTEK